MKRLSSAISMLLFLSILIVPSLLWGVKKVIRSDVWEVQLDENRELAKWPQKFSSDVPSEVEDYYNDHLPFRSVMLHAYSVCDGNLEGFRVIVRGTNTDMDNSKSVVIVFTPEGGEPYTVNMTQSKGCVIALEFRDQDLTGARWIFDEAQPGAVIQSGTLHVGGYAFNYNANGYCQLHAASGWQLGSGETVYVEFPAIAGYKLTRVSFREYNANTAPVITDAKGNVIPGGESLSFKRNELTSYYLSGTAENTPYRMMITNTKTFRFTYIELEYKQ